MRTWVVESGDIPNAQNAPPIHLRLEVDGRGVDLFIRRGSNPGCWPQYHDDDCKQIVVAMVRGKGDGAAAPNAKHGPATRLSNSRDGQRGRIDKGGVGGVVPGGASPLPPPHVPTDCVVVNNNTRVQNPRLCHSEAE